jgi:hypothetical protein
MNITGYSKERRFLPYILARIKIKMHWQIYIWNRQELFGNFTFLFQTELIFLYTNFYQLNF